MDVVLAIADEMKLMQDTAAEEKEKEGESDDDDDDVDVDELHITLKVPNLKPVLDEHLNKSSGTATCSSSRFTWKP